MADNPGAKAGHAGGVPLDLLRFFVPRWFHLRMTVVNQFM